MDLEHPHLQNRVIIMNGFTNEEILVIMRTIKSLCQNSQSRPVEPKATLDCLSGDLIFAKTTATSLQSVLGELIIDMSGDHAYLQANPPNNRNKPNADQ